MIAERLYYYLKQLSKLSELNLDSMSFSFLLHFTEGNSPDCYNHVQLVRKQSNLSCNAGC